MAPAKESDTDFNKIFTEWHFNDLAGNRIKVVPWSLLKSEETLEIVGQIYAGIKEQVPNMNLGLFFSMHLDVFYTKYISKLNQILCITVDKPKDWLKNVDIAMGLEVLEVIWQQNFTGDRVRDQVTKWFIPIPAMEDQSQDELDLILPGNI
jgi:hypothetical protein